MVLGQPLHVEYSVAFVDLNRQNEAVWGHEECTMEWFKVCWPSLARQLAMSWQGCSRLLRTGRLGRNTPTGRLGGHIEDP